MRIVRLDLLAFGPFTGVTLDFERQSSTNLHIVYGPNEAGKSSCLRALRQWLYGIDDRTTDGFLHAYSNLRIGGILEDKQGQRLSFIRRKGRDKTIRDADDEQVIDPAELARFLGRIDEATFRQRFGIDHEELVRGGAQIAAGEGEIGSILFAAGAGIADVRKIQAALDQECRELFLVGGSKPRVNATVKQLEDARRQIRNAVLPTAKWRECHNALRQAEHQQGEADRQILEQRAQRNRLERILKAQPLLSRRRLLEAEWAELALAPLLPADFAARCGEAISKWEAAREAHQNATLAIERVQQAIAETNIPSGLIERHAEIAELHTDLGSYRKGLKDRPGLIAQVQTATQRAQQLLAELGREADLKQTDQLRLNRGQRERILELAGDYKARLARQTSAATRLAKLKQEHGVLAADRSQLPPARDLRELKRVIHRTQRHGDLDEQLLAARTSLKQIERQLEADCQRLPLILPSPMELESWAVPLPETIEQFEAELSEAGAILNRHQERMAELAVQIEQGQQSLERLRLEHDVPTEDDLQRARAERDAAWRAVQRCGLLPEGGADPEAAALIAQWAPGGNLAQAFQASMAAADLVADRLRREAERVADKVRLTAELEERQRQIERERAQLADAQREVERLQQSWLDLWRPLRIDPRSPREMQAWLRRFQAISELARACRQHRLAVDECQARWAECAEQLAAELAALGIALPPQRKALHDLVEECLQVVASNEETTQRRRDLEQRATDLEREIAEVELELSAAGESLRSWQAEWTQAVVSLGLTGDEPPSYASAILQAAQEWSELTQVMSSFQRRIDGIDRDNRQFEERVEQLLTDLNWNLDRPTELVVAELKQRLEAAVQQQTRLEAWQQQLEEAQSQREKATAALAQWQEVLQELCRQAGCESPNDLLAAEQRSAARRRCEEGMRHLDEQLADLAGAEPLASFIANVEQGSIDTVHAQLMRADEAIAALDGKRKVIAEEVGRLRSELERMDGSAAAAAARETAEHLLASLRNDAEQYIRLRLAWAILRRTVERFRQANQGQILHRASELFSLLTLGSFAGLRADYDQDGRAMLVGVRPASRGAAAQPHGTTLAAKASTLDQTRELNEETALQTVSVAGMSDGTCDQMYLALRLALLESHLANGVALPLIVDDILIRFDDERSAAALQLLAQLSQRNQVIFFTHHQRLVDLAKEHLPAHAWSLHELANQRDARPTSSPASSAR